MTVDEDTVLCILNEGFFPPNKIIIITLEKERGRGISLCFGAHNRSLAICPFTLQSPFLHLEHQKVIKHGETGN